jgi:O-antigen/teichoic acid export membrane protein
MTLTENKQAFIATIINYITIALAVIISLFYTPFCISALGDRMYGVRAFALSFVSFLSLVSSAFSGTFLKFRTEAIKEKGEEGDKTNNGAFLFLMSILALVVLLVGITIAIIVSFMPLEDYSSSEVDIIKWLIIISVINTSISIPISLFEMFVNANRKFIFVRSIALFSTLVTPLFSVIILLVCKEVNVAVILLGIVAPIVTLLYFPVTLLYSLKKLHFKAELHFNDSTKKLLKRITLFSLVILICTIIHELIITANTTILGFVNSDVVTPYSLGSTLMVYLTTLGSSAVMSMYPRAYSLDTNKDYEGVNKLFIKTSQITSLIIFMVIGGFISSGQYFIVSWLGDSISDQSQLALIYQITCILFCSQIFNLTSLLSIEILRNRNQQLFHLGLLAGILIITISLSIPLSMWLGALGAAISLLISMTIGYGIVLPIYNKQKLNLPIGKYYLNLLFVTLVTCGACGVTFLFNHFLIAGNLGAYSWLQFLLCGLIFVIIYIGLCLIFFRNTLKSLLNSIFKKNK